MSHTDDLTAPPAVLEILWHQVSDWWPHVQRLRFLLREGGVECCWLMGERRAVLGVRHPIGTEEGQGQRVKGSWGNSLAQNNNLLIQSSCERVLQSCVLNESVWLRGWSLWLHPCFFCCKWFIHACVLEECVCVTRLQYYGDCGGLIKYYTVCITQRSAAPHRPDSAASLT